MRPFTLLLLFVAGALLTAGCTAPREAAVASPSEDVFEPAGVKGDAASVGGTVRNSAPTVEAFSPDATTGENRDGFVVVFTGQVKDRNTEQQIENISVDVAGAGVSTARHAVTPAERQATTEPASFGPDGFKVWTGERNDGVLHFRYRHAFAALAPAGAYVFRAHVTDSAGDEGDSAAATVTLVSFSEISISPTPIDLAGTALAGANWGEWEAEAGERNVEAKNFIRLVNTGDAADTRVVIDLAPAFVGAEDGSFTIPTEGNVQFAWFEDATPATSAPAEGTWTWLPVNGEGSVTVRFTGAGNVIYVKYRIVELPEILPAQAYGISFTVTELSG